MNISTNHSRTIGILGGMGPQASVEFYRLLMEKCVRDYGAVNNDDYPEVIIDSIPVPDFISSLKSLSVARVMLADRIDRLASFGVGRIGIACNTAHLLLDDLRRASPVPVVSIMEEVARIVHHKKFRRVGLFASPITYRSRLFENAIVDTVDVVTPDLSVQEGIDSIIRKVIAGQEPALLKSEALSILTPFVQIQRLDAVILGCTELPLVIPTTDVLVPLISTLDVLADCMLAFCYSRRKTHERAS
ncbi:MAG: amino acid racemase [bacterium]|nr:amino acid racemase [bacterium]